ncbi:gamma-glutamyltransferase [Brevibacterium sp. NPDC049920]|uniref:Gamma-glutamyltransferase n=1 Tax=Brevibacterium pityocampae TaxID=506594 RepID=A0ABP8JHK1_9MICO
MTFRSETTTTRPTLEGTFGMTASTHWLATGSAQAVLELGGDAFDAAVVGAFVLHVVEPHLNGPGGDMTGVFVTAQEPDRPVVLMGQGPAPAGATIEHFRAEGLDAVPGAGALAAAVPGAVDAWLLLLQEHGTWELAEVLAFAIDYAERGHPVLARVAETIDSASALFRTDWPSSADLWLENGQAPEPGSLIRNPEYAQVLRELVATGDGEPTREERIAAARREWRTGRVARSIADFIRTPHRHSDGGLHAGVLTAADMADWTAGFEDALTLDFRGYTIAKTGPWGQGPVLLQALAILDGFDEAHLDPGTELGAHTVLEALKLALADRDTYYGDSGSATALTPEALAVLLRPEYAAERRALIGENASHEFRPGTIPGVDPVSPPLRTEAEFGAAGGLGIGEPTVPKPADPTPEERAAVRGDTCHIDVVDRWGNMVSATPSGGWLQSSPAVPGLGFCLGTRLQMMWLDQNSPSRLEPGTRPRTTLSPTLVLRDGEPVMALGTPGGDQQDQWQLLLLLRLLVGELDPQAAIDAPALHTTAMPGSFYPRTWEPAGAVVEDRLGEDVIAGLERRGHRVTRAGDWALGRLSCVIRDPVTGVLRAAANPRGMQGYAAGR